MSGQFVAGLTNLLNWKGCYLAGQSVIDTLQVSGVLPIYQIGILSLSGIRYIGMRQSRGPGYLSRM